LCAVGYSYRSFDVVQPVQPESVDALSELHVRESMAKQDLEQRMRALEYFHTVRALPGTWTIIRVDSRGFLRLTAS